MSMSRKVNAESKRLNSMTPGAARAFTETEVSELSPGLWDALARAGCRPKVRSQAHPAAFIAALWMRSLPIMAVGKTIWWPAAKSDFAGSVQMAILQHELQHLLDFAERRLSVVSYLLNFRNWTYRYDLSQIRGWEDLGAEQRASMAEGLWLADRSGDFEKAGRLRTLIPWAVSAPVA
jgi:hypothetical protein